MEDPPQSSYNNGHVKRRCRNLEGKRNSLKQQQQSKASAEEEVEAEEPSSPVLKRPAHRVFAVSPALRKSLSWKRENLCQSSLSMEKGGHQVCSISKHSLPSSLSANAENRVISVDVDPFKETILRGKVLSPLQKRIINSRNIRRKNGSPSCSPKSSKKSVLDVSPSTAFMTKDDSFLESINFDEIDSVCSSMMSTPKSRASIVRNRTSSSRKKNCSPYLRTTPHRLNDTFSGALSSKCGNIKESNRSKLSSLSADHVINVSGSSSHGEFGDDESLDLFEVTPSSKSKNRSALLKEKVNICEDIDDVFADSFGDPCESEMTKETVPSVESNSDSKFRTVVSTDSHTPSKTSNPTEEQLIEVSSSVISPSAVNNHGVQSTSVDNTSSSDSQMSFISTADSQPLIGRLQSRLHGFQASQASESVPTEKDLRAEAVAAAVEEAVKVHEAGNEFELGPFFGLPSMVAEALEKHRGISDLYEWQKDCIAVGSGSDNLLFSLPTSGGKTLVAEILMFRQLLLKKKDIIFILPYVSLVQEKVHGLSPFGVDLGFLIEEYAGSRGTFPPKSGRRKNILYIATIEKASGLVNSLLENDRMREVGLVVADEVHMLGEGSGRGATLEGTLTKLRYAARKVQVVAMSATIGNLHEIATFLDAKLYTGDFRPVALSEFVKIEDQIWELNSCAKTEEELLYKQRLCCFPYTKEQKMLDGDMIGGLVGEVVPDHSCIVFCPTRRNCETLAELICRILPRDLTKYRRMEKVALYRAIVEEGGGTVCPTLRKTIPLGVAYHHSGLTEGERRLIEEGYLVGTLCCVCCTSTLAAGVNLPARRVIIRSPYTGSEFLTRSRYKQMVGRAGRAGLDTCGESFLILQRRDMKWAGELLLSPMDVCLSTLVQRNDHGLISLLFSCIGLGVTISLPALKRLAASSLLQVQSTHSQVDVEAKVVEILEALRRKGMVRIKDPSEENAPISAPSTCESRKSDKDSLSGGSTHHGTMNLESLEELSVHAITSPVHDTDLLTVSRLGRAAIKGNIDLNLARRLYSDLSIARESLAVNCHLHLLYLVVPYDIASSVKVVPDVLYKAFLNLGEEEVKVAKLLGITEAVLIKLTMGQKSKKVTEDVLQRFYVGLILHQLWLGTGIWEVSDHFHMHRGFTQQLLQASAAFASCIHHFCEELEELWAFRDLLGTFARQLSGCCSAELLPLLDLPAVKKGRAKMLHRAGYRTLHDIANAEAKNLTQVIDHLPYRTATQIINSAKMLLLEKAESLQGEAEEVLLGLH